MMKRYSRVFPPCLAMSSPAALAEPPGFKFELFEREQLQCNQRTCGDQVVDHNDGLACFDRTSLHFK